MVALYDTVLLASIIIPLYCLWQKRMKLYLAGVFPEGLYRATVDEAYIHRKPWKKHFKKVPYLESYYEIRNNTRMLDCIQERGDKIFLDSGAFSAFTQGVEVDLRDYATFIREHEDIITTASNFDVIGRNMERQSYDNLKILERYLKENGSRMGVQPVHHARDHDSWLEKYLKEGYDYIFLGGMVPESTPYLRQWLDRVWDRYLTDGMGRPRVRVHGFGLTTESLMLDYPWYSVDSTSWKMYSIMGFLVATTKNENGTFGRNLQSVAVSERHPARKQYGRHYNNISTEERLVFDKCIKKLGFKSKTVREDRATRSVYNLRVYREFMKKAPFAKTFNDKQMRIL